jgi:uncharacterized membrane protein
MAITAHESITIDAPLREVYRFWQDLAHLPAFVDHLESVTRTGPGQSHWVARAPLGITLAWDAEIIEEPDRLVAWRSLPDAVVANAGTVRFAASPGGAGTTVDVSLEFEPPGGPLRVAGTLFANAFTRHLEAGLRRVKELIEASQAPR